MTKHLLDVLETIDGYCKKGLLHSGGNDEVRIYHFFYVNFEDWLKGFIIKNRFSAHKRVQKEEIVRRYVWGGFIGWKHFCQIPERCAHGYIFGVHWSFLDVHWCKWTRASRTVTETISCSESSVVLGHLSDSQSLPIPLILDFYLGICIWAPNRKSTLQQWGWSLGVSDWTVINSLVYIHSAL